MTSGPQDFEMTDEHSALIAETRSAVDKAIKDYIQAIRGPAFPDDAPYVQGWAVGVEWTNIWTEQENIGGQDVLTPYGQMLSITAGLGLLISKRTL